MPKEITNSVADASESALSSSISLDDAVNLDWVDPGEQDTDLVDDEQQSDDGTVETDDETDGHDDDTTADDDDAEDDGQSDEESETDDDGENEDQPLAAEVKDDAIITLPSGESLSFGEVKSGYMRQADYSRKTQELGNKRRELEALSTNVTQAVEAIAGHLEKTLPPAPDPQLAITNPNEYTRKKALHEHAMGQLSEVLKMAHAPKQATKTLTEQQHRELVASETAKLAEAFPQVRTPEGHKKFFDTASEVARELGYSEDEIGQATDHRLFKLAHWAKLGMQAEAAKAKAKDKVKNAPPVAPAKRQKGNNAAQARKNAEGMRRLQKTGSIHDAMLVDFD